MNFILHYLEDTILFIILTFELVAIDFFSPICTTRKLIFVISSKQNGSKRKIIAFVSGLEG